MTTGLRPYSNLGFALLLLGGSALVVSLFDLQSDAISGVGLAAVMVAVVCLALDRTMPTTSAPLAGLLIDSGLGIVDDVTAEFGRAGAIYLPSSRHGARGAVLLPLHQDGAVPDIRGSLGPGLLVQYGDRPQDIAMQLSTPGTRALQLLESKPGPSESELAAALTTLLVGTFDLATGVEVFLGEGKLVVVVEHPRSSLGEGAGRPGTLGSLIASICASAAAEAYDRPVTVRSESDEGRRKVVELDLLR